MIEMTYYEELPIISKHILLFLPFYKKSFYAFYFLSKSYFTNKDFPVISSGCSIPINSINVGAISAKHPFSLNV